MFIANEESPVCIQASILKDTSPVFETFLKYGHLGKDGPDVLKFPEDDLDVWQALTFWMFNKTIPTDKELSSQVDCESIHFVRCWCLGEKYQIGAFQDAAMLELLHTIDKAQETAIWLEAIKEAFEESPDGSVLRKLMAEVAVDMLEVSREISDKDLEQFDGIVGFARALLHAHRDFRDERSWQIVRDFGGAACNQTSPFWPYLRRWKRFMLYGGPEQHWIYELQAKDKVR